MLKSVIIVALTMLFLDAIWLTLRRTYHETLIESIQGSPVTIRIIPAILIYILVPIAITYFVINESKSLNESVLKGGLFGFTLYALYDLTNLATFKRWTTEMAIIDSIWGLILCSSSAAAGFYFK
jgi:uncharacterized membrane protein